MNRIIIFRGRYHHEDNKENEENPKIIAEADDEREECVKHYINSDASFSAVSYLNPIHFKKNGTWNDINNNLSPI